MPVIQKQKMPYYSCKASASCPNYDGIRFPNHYAGKKTVLVHMDGHTGAYYNARMSIMHDAADGGRIHTYGIFNYSY
jgi:hypothetical protein